MHLALLAGLYPFFPPYYSPTIIVIVVAVVIIICVRMSFRYRGSQLSHETLRRMAEQGQPVTPEVIAALKVRSAYDAGGSERSRRDLRSGIILIGLGAGIMFFLGRMGGIVLFLGVAFLILSFLDRSDPPKSPPPFQSPNPPAPPSI
jgi:hypothetical protein